MKLSEEMKNKTLLSFELFPPKTEKGLQNLPGRNHSSFQQTIRVFRIVPL